MRPKITVYITCHNYGRFVAQAIDSVYAQILNDWELIIIDDGSTDDSMQVIEAKAAEQAERVRIFHNDEPGGLPKCANLAINEAHGEYIVRLDADDWFDESALLTMASYLDAHEDIAMVFPNYIYVDQDGTYLGVENRKKIGSESQVLDLPAHGACTMTRKRVLRAVGGYSTEYKAQDGHEIWLKILHRYKVANVSTPLFFYRQHAHSLTQSSDRVLAARKEIKRGAQARQKGEVGITVAGIIPARNNLPRVKNICMEEIAGRPLIDYSLDAALGAGVFDRILVTSDDHAVLEHCKAYDSQILTHHRSEELAQTNTRLVSVIENAVEHLEQNEGYFPDAITMMNVHSPLKEAADIVEAVDHLVLYSVDSVISVYEDHDLHFKHGEQGLQPINPGALNQLFLEREALFVDNRAILSLWRDVVSGPNLFGKSYGHTVMPMDRSFVIRDPFSRWVVEQQLIERQNKKTDK